MTPADLTDKDIARFNSKFDRGAPDACWPWRGGCTPYGRLWIVCNALGRNYGAHRIAWMLANKPPIPPGLLVCHKCDNPPCVNPAHLFVGTKGDNNRDCIAKHRHVPIKDYPCPPERIPRGTAHWAAKHTPEIIHKIKQLVASGQSQRATAKQFDINQSYISRIIRGKAWAHVE